MEEVQGLLFHGISSNPAKFEGFFSRQGNCDVIKKRGHNNSRLRDHVHATSLRVQKINKEKKSQVPAQEQREVG